MKKNEGITLIALIITIIILVILTAVTLNNVIGSNLIGLATKAAADYIDAAEEENEVMQKTLALSEGKATAKDSKVQPGVEVASDTGTEQDGEIKYNYTDVMGRHAMVPEGFKVSTDVEEQFIEDGLVIEDKDGNEFVWVPCYYKTKPEGTADDVQQYISHKYETQNDLSGSTVEKNGSGWKTYYYTNYSDWKDEASESDNSYGNVSVKKYGGFYIARYEAGWNGDPTVKVEAGTDYVSSYGAAQQHLSVTNQKPVSKKGVFSWNFISQKNAKTVSENMYDNGTTEGSVQSKLVDGAAWDTVTNWIANTGVNVTTSSKYGNYLDTDLRYNGLYAKHIWAVGTGDDKTNHWLCAKHFSNGAITLKQEQIQKPYDETKAGNYADTGIANGQSHNYYTRYELPTGSLENFKLKNIYDLAGNMWEWTTEVGGHTVATAESSTTETTTATTNNSSFAVFRGGGFNSDGTDHPLCYRDGGGSSSAFMHVDFGFRVVLYVK